MLLGVLSLVLAGVCMAIDSFTMSLNPPPTAGSPFEITWNPDGPSEVNVLLNTFDNSGHGGYIITFTEVLAKISNTGSWKWTVPVHICGERHSFSIQTANSAIGFGIHSYSESFTIAAAAGSSCSPTPPVTVYPTTQSCTTAAPEVTATGPGPHESAIIQVISGSWMYPIRGQPATIRWWPNNDSDTVLLMTSFGGVPTDQTTYYIDKAALNNGSYKWNVPSNFAPGSYVLTIRGKNSQALQSIIVGNVAPPLCGTVNDIPNSSNTITTPPAQKPKTTITTSRDSETEPIVPTGPQYDQILNITTCSTSINPSYSNYITTGTSTSFPFVGCPQPGIISPYDGPSGYPCPSGGPTFTAGITVAICCPVNWGTTSLDKVYCYSHVSSVSSQGDIWGWSSSSPNKSTLLPTAVEIRDMVFARPRVASGVRMIDVPSTLYWFVAAILGCSCLLHV